MAKRRAADPLPKPGSEGATGESDIGKLIADSRRGNDRALSALVRAYRAKVLALAFRITRDRDEAADVAQTVFLKMASNLWRYDEQKRLFTWLYRITVNASIDHLRRVSRHRHEALEDFGDLPQQTTLGPEFGYRRSQVRRHVDRAVGRLSETQRRIFQLRDIEGCKVGDVADRMNVPQATVRWHLHRAHLRIRRELMRTCPRLLALMGIR
jgi:RNA polymerase sigma-70 factor, ECF subfamily